MSVSNYWFMFDQLIQIQSELERMNIENQRLRGMLSQVTNNYAALQVHLATIMEQQNARAGRAQEHDQV